MSTDNPKRAYSYCSVPLCKKDPTHKSFGLPKDPELANSWMMQIGVAEKSVTRRIYVCEAHFENTKIWHSLDMNRKRLIKRSIPTLNLPCNNNEHTITQECGDFLANIIVKSLTKPSSPQTNTEAPKVESSSVSFKKKGTNKSDNGKINKKQKLCPMQSDTGLKDPDYAANAIGELQKKVKEVISEVPEGIEQLALKMYLKCPQAYKILHCSLRLPPAPALKDLFDSPTSISTDIETLFAKTLQYKASFMSEEQKHCIFCIGEISVKRNLYYNIKYDKLLGVSHINNIQKPEPARKAIVLTVQGVFANWKQPIAVAYVGAREQVDLPIIKQWIERNIHNILQIGFIVRAVVSETDYLQTELPYIQAFEHRIYQIYDALYLFKLFYDNWVTHDYSFIGGIARRKHLLDYYDIDSKKPLRLSPNLTEKHMKPAKLEDVNIKHVTDVINMDTAAAMSAYIDFHVLDKSAKGTVQLITHMSTLFEVLRSNNSYESVKSPSGEKQTRTLLKMLSFLNNFNLIHCTTKQEIPKKGTFVEKFEKTIKALLMMYEDNITLSNDYKSLPTVPTRRLSLDNLASFFERVRSLERNSIRPTCKTINSAFMQSTLQSILGPIKKEKILPLEREMEQMKDVISDFESDPQVITRLNTSIGRGIEIKCSEYNTLDLKRKDAIVLLAGFLLKKCYDHHADCVAMKNYICIVLHDNSSICKTILNEIQQGVCVVPHESFIEFVEMMEIRFRSYMTKNILETLNSKLINGLLLTLQLVSFPMPCVCFPILYAKKLYLRTRIHNMIQYNNSLIPSGKSKYGLIVNNF